MRVCSWVTMTHVGDSRPSKMDPLSSTTTACCEVLRMRAIGTHLVSASLTRLRVSRLFDEFVKYLYGVLRTL